MTLRCPQSSSDNIAQEAREEAVSSRKTCNVLDDRHVLSPKTMARICKTVVNELVKI